MEDLKNKRKELEYQSPRCSTSTIDSDTAAEIIRQYEVIKNISNTNLTFPNIEQTQSNTLSPKVHNTMKFDKSEGIHVGDVINYYCGSPTYTASTNSNSISKSPTSNSDVTLISSVDSNERKLLSCVSRKQKLLIMLISVIIMAITGGVLFMMRHKLIGIDMTETTTIKFIITTEVDIPTTTTSSDVLTTTTSEITYPTTEHVIPTIPSIITLESFVSRKQWNAEQPRATVDLTLPIYRIIIAHTASESCNTEQECTKFVQDLQRNSTHLDDIPYNFLIGNDSKIYEGRGFEYEGQHTSNNNATEYNSIGICVAFIGHYKHETISESQVKVFEDFIEFFKKSGVISENYTIFMQDQLMKTDLNANGLLMTVQNWNGYRKLQKIHNRIEWNAEPPKLLEKFSFPMNWSIITSTADQQCSGFTNCSETVKKLQTKAFGNNLNDIPFGFIIGGDGLIFEGRGWDYIGQHTEDFDTKTVAICAIGSYGVRKPNQTLLDATHDLLEDGKALGKLTPNYIVNGRQELRFGLTGPGGDFLAEIRKWKHWKYWGIPKKLKNKSTKF
ncbi:peptidoglycan recognition protein 3-like [Chironomus tepperi]|uniref:peptidoglycan recognition protein 3-like n=1 Tax=Chironomus tepperi TaxID=113505 RepID=UPI00391F69E2